MKFIDEAHIRVEAGDGGDGCIAFLREKFRPNGGPAGGDGGHGGDIVACADPGLTTLLDVSLRRVFRGERGQDGRGKSRHGRAGTDTVIRMPVGTQVRRPGAPELTVDLVRAGQAAVLAAGGHGGRGNARFATPTHQAPRQAEKGRCGQARDLVLELRLLADAGLVGLPNAGKSSLLTRVSAARPKVADYPFTTLEPALGVVRAGAESSFVLADVPGLIAGASRGSGLGLKFLRHLSRTRLLVHLLDCSMTDQAGSLAAFETVTAELAAHSAGLAGKPQLAVLSKCDLSEVRKQAPALRKALEDRNIEVHTVSAASGDGIEELVAAIARRLAGG